MKNLLRRMWREFTGANIDPEVAAAKQAALPRRIRRPRPSALATLDALTGNPTAMVTERAVHQSASQITQAIIDSAQYRDNPRGEHRGV